MNTTGRSVAAGPTRSSLAWAIWIAGSAQSPSRWVLTRRNCVPRIFTSTDTQPRLIVIGPMFVRSTQLVAKCPV